MLPLLPCFLSPLKESVPDRTEPILAMELDIKASLNRHRRPRDHRSPVTGTITKYFGDAMFDIEEVMTFFYVYKGNVQPRLRPSQ